jgi:hypothetical protein
MKKLSDLLPPSAGAAVSLKVRSAINPMLWLCAIVTVPALGLATISPPHMAWLMAAAALLPLTVACGVFVLLAIKDPDRLQSEEFQLQRAMIDVAQQKGSALETVDVTVKELVPRPEAIDLGAKAHE